MSNETCAAKSTKFPKLDWTLDRQGKTIFKQCAYFNGERLTREEDLADSVASGGPCNDVEGESIEGKCSYEFELPSDYVVTSYHQNDCVEPGTSTYRSRYHFWRRIIGKQPFLQLNKLTFSTQLHAHSLIYIITNRMAQHAR